MAWKAQVFIVCIFAALVCTVSEETNGTPADNKSEDTAGQGNPENSNKNDTASAHQAQTNATNDNASPSNQTNPKNQTQDGSPPGNKPNATVEHVKVPEEKNVYFVVYVNPKPQENKPNATSDDKKDPKATDTKDKDKQKDKPTQDNKNSTTTHTNGTAPIDKSNSTKDDESYEVKSSFVLRNSQPDDRLTTIENKGTIHKAHKNDSSISKNKDSTFDKQTEKPIVKNNATNSQYILINPSNQPSNIGVVLPNPSGRGNSLSLVPIPGNTGYNLTGRVFYRIPNSNYYALSNGPGLVPTNNGQYGTVNVLPNNNQYKPIKVGGQKYEKPNVTNDSPSSGGKVFVLRNGQLTLESPNGPNKKPRAWRLVPISDNNRK